MEKEKCVVFYTDDDEDDREIFEDAFKSVNKDCSISTQANGAELLQLLKKHGPQPNLLFLDLNMPVKNGYDVLKEIRQNESMAGLPVVIFSTSDDLKAISASRALGANLYIPKPASFSQLKKVISHALAIDWKKFPSSTDNFVYRAN